MELMQHQIDVLKMSENLNRVAYFYDMGLGKTFIGAEKAASLNANILVVCQKSKVQDWVEHFNRYYNYNVFDLTVKKNATLFWKHLSIENAGNVGVINYDSVWRRNYLCDMRDFTLMLDESSLIQNDTSKRTKFILKKLFPSNVILLSGTPCNGKYELLLSQFHLLGWDISKELFNRQYCEFERDHLGYPKIVGYKNIERLKRKMRLYGCFFKKTEEVLTLPEQRFIKVKIPVTNEYKEFIKNSVICISLSSFTKFVDDSDFYGRDVTPHIELVGDTPTKKLLYARQLAGVYNKQKLQSLSDLIESTSDRLIIFYNFNAELDAIKKIIPSNRPLSYINGEIKNKTNYEKYDNSITLVQYQSGAMGHNLQLANKIIYFSPTLSNEMYEQSKKRIHRIGQRNSCTYYNLVCGVEEHIYSVLAERKDYTDELFIEKDDEYAY